MTIGVGDIADVNAAALERVLAGRRLELTRIGEGEERDRLADALSMIEEYTALLRAPAPERSGLAPYWFKLVFPDGRWSVDEGHLAAPPSEGDLVALEGHGTWRIERSERIRAKPAGKRSREFFVCAPA